MIANPITWPDGKKCAVAVTFDMDADSLVHIADPARAPKLVSATSMLRYGPEIPAWCAETHPGAVEAIAEAGHEVALHSYIHEHSYDLSRDAEAHLLARSAAILEQRHPGAGVSGLRRVRRGRVHDPVS